MLGYVLGFLIVAAAIALAWRRRRHRAEDPANRVPGLTLAKPFLGGWGGLIVLVVAGFVAFGIWAIVTFVGYANMIGDLPKIDGCFNC